ncbi:hypothetical protein B0H14DRAFT_2906579 [Mycena olivaceomarginata]|nr:hypothetical protein B0H14DRAFT_2906579 [Mycena olivaceomarginata]
MSSSNTWAEEGTNTFFSSHASSIPTGERMPKKRLSFARRMVPYIIIIILSLAIIVAVIVTGLLDPPPNMPAPAPNSLAVGVIISMKNFDPAFLAKLDDDNGPMDADAIPVCFFVTDPQGLSSPLILSMNYGNKRNFNSTSMGSISHFPIDIYSGSLVIGAQSLTHATDNSVVPCPEFFDYDLSEANDITATVLPLYFEIAQDLDSFSAHTSLQQLSENDTLAYFGGGTVLLSATIHRRELVRFFAVLMFITTWLVTLGVHPPRSLFALPSLRSATPGIPATPTVSDAVGYFWHIALLALSTFVLLCHAIWKMMNDKAEEEGANKKSLKAE